MIDWTLAQRSERERRIVFAGLAVGLPMVIWLAIWQPLWDWRKNAERDYQNKRQTLEWMQGAAVQVRALQNSAATSGRQGGSPEQLITRAAASLGLTVSRIEPTGDQRFNVFFAAASYEGFLRFVQQVRSQGLVTQSLTMARLPQQGDVSVRMTLGVGG